jgi:hypothetical protein
MLAPGDATKYIWFCMILFEEEHLELCGAGLVLGVFH